MRNTDDEVPATHPALRDISAGRAQRRALIVGTGRDRGALAAARSLRQAGWFVGVGTPDSGGMLGASRACDAHHLVPRPRHNGSAFIEGVRQAVEAGAYDIVFGGGDDWMAALAEYRSEIPTLVAHPDAGVVEAALDKVQLSQYAARVGLAAPSTELATDQSVQDWRGPVVVKCREHWSPGQTRPHRIEAKLFPDITAALPQIKRIRQAGAQPVLQQVIRGGLGALIGVFHGGHLSGRTQQLSTRLWPTPNGASARAETIPVDEELARKVEALLSELGWHGLVELQFLTGDDGVPYLIDLNGRFFGSMALANAARPGLTDMWGRLLLGESVASLDDARPGVRYVWLAGDLRRASVERRGGLVADVVSTLAWSRRAQHSIWDPRDVGPTLNLAMGRFARGK
ncbi:putative ATP-grasp superfamily ATP-dependent carboligase [Arthrobacter sp. CAN_A214]|uniref:carboxylate--amine ligase n=1 Tax=Arthrobacter sp. CAN_A214 TaxID=2787720 RepID=UPI001A1EA6F7